MRYFLVVVICLSLNACFADSHVSSSGSPLGAMVATAPQTTPLPTATVQPLPKQAAASPATHIPKPVPPVHVLPPQHAPTLSSAPRVVVVPGIIPRTLAAGFPADAFREAMIKKAVALKMAALELKYKKQLEEAKAALEADYKAKDEARVKELETARADMAIGFALRTATLEDEFKTRFDTIDLLAERKSIAHVAKIAMQKPTLSGVKEESTLKLTPSTSLTLFVDNVVHYEPYSVFVFNLEPMIKPSPDAKPVSLIDARLYAVNDVTKALRPIEAAKVLPDTLGASGITLGSLAVLDADLNPKEKLRLQILTDGGNVEVTW